MPETLHYVDLFLWSDEMCQDAFSNADYVEMSESGSEICTYGVVSIRVFIAPGLFQFSSLFEKKICKKLIQNMCLSILASFFVAKSSIFYCEP